MARVKKQPTVNAPSSKKKRGPWLAAAVFCDMTLEDTTDRALSIIRIIDSINLLLPPNTPPEIPSEEHKVPAHVAGLLCFKTGDSPGEHSLRVVAHSPTGKKQTVHEQMIPFSPEPYGGGNLRLNITVKVNKGGLFWFHIFLDDKEVVRMPLQITVKRAESDSFET
jgi:hypothetical protein